MWMTSPSLLLAPPQALAPQGGSRGGQLTPQPLAALEPPAGQASCEVDESEL